MRLAYNDPATPKAQATPGKHKTIGKVMENCHSEEPP